MDVQVNVDGDAVQKAIVQAVLDSTIGAEIQKAISDQLTKTWSRETIVTNAVKAAIERIISQQVDGAVKERRAEIEKFVADQMTDELFQKALNALWQHLIRGT